MTLQAYRKVSYCKARPNTQSLASLRNVIAKTHSNSNYQAQQLRSLCIVDYIVIMKWQDKPADIASGMPLLVTAADRRARAIYYSFTLVCIGLLVVLIVILIESHKWRNTVATESKVHIFSPHILFSN